MAMADAESNSNIGVDAKDQEKSKDVESRVYAVE